MKPYATDEAFRTALEARLANEARDQEISIDRLRRKAAFERILVRLNSDHSEHWVLKGGMALEIRFAARARTTKDLDLNYLGEVVGEDDVRGKVEAALSIDPEEDGFRFSVGRARPLAPDRAGNPAWRMPVTASLAQRAFVSVRLDVAARPDEQSDTELLRLPGHLSFVGLPPRQVRASPLPQTIAEKVHALTLDRGDRENTRVRDLVDLVLLIETGHADSAAVARAAETVFGARATHDIPETLADPPHFWGGAYHEMAAELELQATTVEQAMILVSGFWEEVAAESKKGG